MQNMLRGSWRQCALVVLFACSACDETIVHDLSEVQANRVLVALAHQGVSAEKVREVSSWSIAVPSSSATTALTVLEAHRTLKDLAVTSRSESGSLIQSREERMHRVEREVSQSLEQTLETIPAVLEARVHLNLNAAQQLSFLSEKPHQSASVLLVARSGAAIDRAQVQRLVSGAAGINEESVSVVISEDVNKPEAAVLAVVAAPNQPSGWPKIDVQARVFAVSTACVILLLLFLMRVRQKQPENSTAKSQKPLKPAF